MEKENEYQNKMAKLMRKPNILVVKLQGQPELIYRFLSEVQKIVPSENIDVSQLLRNKGMPGCHLFFRIDFAPMSDKKENDAVVEEAKEQ